jgi:hypothetical protein
VNPTLSEINKVSEGNAVEFPQFLEIVGAASGSDTKAEMVAAFQAYDVAGTGNIDAAALKHILGNSGDKLSKVSCAEWGLGVHTRARSLSLVRALSLIFGQFFGSSYVCGFMSRWCPVGDAAAGG